MKTADQPGLVRIVVDRLQLDAIAARLEQGIGPPDRDLADAACPQTAADGDALRLAPALHLQEAPYDGEELLGEFLDGAVNEAGGQGVAAHQELVELFA